MQANRPATAPQFENNRKLEVEKCPVIAKVGSLWHIENKNDYNPMQLEEKKELE